MYVRGSESLMDEAQHVLNDAVHQLTDRGVTDWGRIKTQIKDALSEYVWKRTKRRPMIIPIIMEV